MLMLVHFGTLQSSSKSCCPSLIRTKCLAEAHDLTARTPGLEQGGIGGGDREAIKCAKSEGSGCNPENDCPPKLTSCDVQKVSPDKVDSFSFGIPLAPIFLVFL